MKFDISFYYVIGEDNEDITITKDNEFEAIAYVESDLIKPYIMSWKRGNRKFIITFSENGEIINLEVKEMN